MKKFFGLILLGVGFLLPGINGKQSVKEEGNQQVKVNDLSSGSSEKKNLTPKQEQEEIQNRLKGLGYFQ